MELESMAVELPEVEGHPNRAEFRGVLTIVDVPSQRAPSGSKGHRVVLTRAAAEEALPSLLGMALDYAPSFDRHDARRKVGVITSAEIVGRSLEIGGYLYAKDFPEVVEEIARSGRRAVEFNPRTSGLEAGNRSESPKGNIPTLCGRRTARPGRSNLGDARTSLRASLAAAVERLRELTSGIAGKKVARLQAGDLTSGGAGPELGMSFEVADVILADRRSSVWILTKVTFTGAAILRRNRAAYAGTWIGLTPESRVVRKQFTTESNRENA